MIATGIRTTLLNERLKGEGDRPKPKFQNCFLQVSHNQDCASLATMAGFDKSNIKCLHGSTPSPFNW